MATKRKRTEPPAKQWPQVIECIGEPHIDQKPSEEASCWNGIVRVERFRITVEKLDEPLEVIHERLRRLWRSTTNYHHHTPVRAEAKRFGLELDGNEFGADAKRDA